MGLLKKDGKLVVRNGKFVLAKPGCPCCGGDCSPTCNLAQNPAAVCPNGQASAFITCTQPNCDKHPDFNTCVDYGTPAVPDRLVESLKQQGWKITINDGDDHPDGCCDCQGTSHYSVFACCIGQVSFDEAASRVAPVNPDHPCENCVAGGDGIVREGDLWRVYLCEPPPPPKPKWFCDNGVCRPCAKPLRADAQIVPCPQGVQLYDTEGECNANCNPCQTPCADCVYQTAAITVDLPAEVELDGDGNVLATFPAYQGTLTLQLQDVGGNYQGFSNFPGAPWGVFGQMFVQNCDTNNDGKWQMALEVDQGGEGNIGTRRLGADFAACCGVGWKGAIGPKGEKAEVTFGLARTEENPLP